LASFFSLFFHLFCWLRGNLPAIYLPVFYWQVTAFPSLSFFWHKRTKERLTNKPKNHQCTNTRSTLQTPPDPLCKHHCATIPSPYPEPSMFCSASRWSSSAMWGCLVICLRVPLLALGEGSFVGAARLGVFWWLCVRLQHLYAPMVLLMNIAKLLGAGEFRWVLAWVLG